MGRPALVAALIAATLALAGVASAAPPEGSLRLTLVSSSEGQLGPRSFFFTDTVYQGGNVIGSERAVCRFTGHFENPRCRITLFLPGGRLFVFVRITPDPRGSFRVTGGTGKYEGRTGIGIYKNLNEAGTRTRVIIWLTSQRAPS
jgi:hypothetical protein